MSLPPDNSVLVMASMRRYCLRYLSRARWRETHFGRSAYNAVSAGLHVQETPLVSVESITFDGELLAVDDYRLDHGRGAIMFRCSYSALARMEIVYLAGYDPLPEDLQYVLDAATATMSANGGASGGIVLMPGVTSVDIPDVGSVRFSDPSQMSQVASLLPALQPYESILSGYRDTSVLLPETSLRNVELFPEVTP